MKFISEVNRETFFAEWDIDNEQSDKENPNPDQTNRNRLEQHKNSNFHYYLVELEEKDLSRLLLPHHNHGISVGSSGIALSEYGKLHINEVENNPNKDVDCILRIQRALKWFYNPNGKKLFMSISDTPLPALGEAHYQGRGQGFLYAASSHKFAAYAIYVYKEGFKPEKVYLMSEKAFQVGK
jgi:hypothetical protein